MITLILSFCYAVRAGIECITRTITVIFPIVFIFMTLIILPGAFPLDYSNVLPAFQNVPNKVLASIPGLLACFGGFETLLFYTGFVKKPGKLYKPVIIAMIFITVFYMVIGIICIAAFGDKFSSDMIWPLLEFVRDINFPGLFIERLDGIMLSLWTGTIFACCISLYFVASYSISKVIGTKEQKQYVLPLSVLIYYLALQPDNLAQLYKWGDILFQYILPVMAVLLPVLLLAVAKLRGLGVKNNGKA
jgi:spore germination protein